MNKSPNKVSDPKEKSFLTNNNSKAPDIPKNMPAILRTVILFLRIMAEAIITNIGLEVIMIPAFIGVVRFKP